MNMPVFNCPVCRTTLTWDVVFAHQGVRDMMLALVDAHTEGAKLLRPMLAYIGLFAPNKTMMRYERIAHLARELVSMIRDAQIERNGQVYAAPMGYWQQAFEEITSRHHAGALRTPLTGHGYLLEVIAGYSRKESALAERQLEKQRAGHAGSGSNPNRPIGSRYEPVPIGEVTKKSSMPAHVKQALRDMNVLKNAQGE